MKNSDKKQNDLLFDHRRPLTTIDNVVELENKLRGAVVLGAVVEPYLFDYKRLIVNCHRLILAHQHTKEVESGDDFGAKIAEEKLEEAIEELKVLFKGKL